MTGAVHRFLRAHGWEAASAVLYSWFVSWPLLHPGKLIAGLDTIAYTVPNEQVAFAALRAGRLPAWNPYVFGGAPLLANPQVGIFYPLKWPFLFVSAHRAVLLIVALHLALLAVGMVVLLGGVLRLRSPAPLVGAIVLVASGVVMVKSAAHFEQFLAIAWGPWLFAAVDGAAAGRFRTRGRAVAAIAAVSGMMILAGHQQPAYILFAFATAWAVTASLAARRFAAIASTFGGYLLGGGIAAVQALPTMQMIDESVRSGGLPLSSLAAPAYLLPLRTLPTVFLGDVFAPSAVAATGGVEASAFVGAAAVTAALLGLVASFRDRDRRALGLLLASAAAAAALLALGPRTPVFRMLFATLPGFDLFRVPGRWVLVTDLCLAVLAALAVDAAARNSLRRRDLGNAAGLAALGALVIWIVPFNLPPAGARIVWLVAGAAALAAFAAAGLAKPRLLALSALVLLPAAELGAMAMHSVMREVPTISSGFRTTGEVARFLRGRPERVVSLGADEFGNVPYLARTLRPNINEGLGIRSLDGYDGGPWITRRWVAAMEAFTEDAFNPDLTLRAQLRHPLDPVTFARFGVRWLVIDADLFDPDVFVPGWRGPVTEQDGVQVWENPDFAGEAFLYPATMPAGERPGPRMRALATTVALVGEKGPHLVCTSACDRLPVVVRRLRPERLLVRARSPSASLLVVAEQWDAGWRAMVDGTAVRPVMADGLLLGIPITEGAHRVELAYLPPGLVSGSTLTLAFLIVTLSLAAGGRRRAIQSHG